MAALDTVNQLADARIDATLTYLCTELRASALRLVHGAGLNPYNSTFVRDLIMLAALEDYAAGNSSYLHGSRYAEGMQAHKDLLRRALEKNLGTEMAKKLLS